MAVKTWWRPSGPSRCARLCANMPYRLMGLASSRRASFALTLIVSAACSLTEEVRTRPGGPGEVPSFGDGGRGGRQPLSGGSSGLDAGGGDGDVDGAHGGVGGDASGSGGRSGAGGGPGPDGGGAPVDSGYEPGPCPVDVTFACHDYCGALSLVSD